MVKEGIRAFTTASLLVTRLSVFSVNETKDDIATGDLQYLLIDAFLGDLYLRVISDDRMKVLQTAEGYFKSYLHKLERHELLDKADRATLDDLEKGIKRDAIKTREYKIAQFKREKETKTRLAELEARQTGRAGSKAKSSSNDNGDAFDDDDDEIARDHTLLVLQSQVMTSLNQLEFIQREYEMLQFVQTNGPPPPPEQRPGPNSSSSTPFKPIVIKDTRTALQQQVFRPGWRQPTMTLDEFLALEQTRGNVVTGGGPQQEEAMRLAKEEKEYLDSDADADADTYKARKWDDYTDDHKRGSGNLFNRS
jgi:hypothetical protein